MHVWSAIQDIALEHEGHYGYRRITAELRRTGMLVNHKRVARIMREDSLIGASRENSVGRNTRRGVLVNLAAGMDVTGINQLWVARMSA
jgi:putative transposase